VISMVPETKAFLEDMPAVAAAAATASHAAPGREVS
jgi:hypothetical protein